MEITVFTIVYNGYGRYVSQWLDNIFYQTVKPKEIIIVLGENHGTPIEVIKKAELNNIKLIYEETARTMGYLCNLAIDKATSEWILRIDVDDKLLSNAIMEIEKKTNKYDVIGLLYKIQSIKNPTDTIYGSEIGNNYDWRKIRLSGYIASKRIFQGKILYYENHEIPNFPYIFLINSLGMRWGYTDNSCVIYTIQENSHSHIKTKAEKNKFAEYLDERAEFYKQKEGIKDDNGIYDSF